MEEEPLPPPAETPASETPPVPPPPRRRWLKPAIAILAVIAVAAIALTLWGRWMREKEREVEWSRLGDLEPSGGVFYPKRMELAVPLFRQGDPRWRADLLGPTDGTLGAEGCAITSAAMVLAYYGIDTDPQRLNEFLNGNGGYTPQGWVYWEKAAELAPERVRHVYEAPGSYQLIDHQLSLKNPVIVKLRLASGITHFVVIAGKDGYDYLTRDPGAGAGKGLYPLAELGSKILGLRYYEKLSP